MENWSRRHELEIEAKIGSKKKGGAVKRKTGKKVQYYRQERQGRTSLAGTTEKFREK